MTSEIKVQLDLDILLKRNKEGDYYLEHKASPVMDVEWDAADPDVIASGLNDWTEEDWAEALADADDLALVMERCGGPSREITLDELAEL